MGILVSLRNQTDNYFARDQARFRSWHVESLLIQAGELLDACVANRQYLRILEEKRTEVVLAVAEAINEITISNQRIAGLYYHREEEIAREANDPQRTRIWNELQAAQGIAQTWVNSVPNSPEKLALSHAKIAQDTEDADRAVRAKIITVARAERERMTDFVNRRVLALQKWLAEVHTDATQTRLYLDDQIDALLKLVIADFKDAYDRLGVAFTGLTELYGYTQPPPEPIPPGATSPLGLIDQANAWVRGANRWLTAVLQYDQEFTMVFSLQKLLGADMAAIKTALSTGNKAKCEFRLDSATIATDHAFVRLRGISIVGEGLKGVLSAKLTVPQKAVSRHLSNGVMTSKTFDQGDVPVISVGRIEDATVARPPELVGWNAAANASPFGPDQTAGFWDVTFEPAFNTPVTCDDLRLELRVAGRPA
jgi:hypothetical protein